MSAGPERDFDAYTHVVMGKIPAAKSPAISLQKTMIMADRDNAQPMKKSCAWIERKVYDHP